jgi:hypothetical protein
MTIEHQTQERVAAALNYAARGWSVFPLHGVSGGACTCGRADCSSPAKHPRTRHGLREATTDLGGIREWWARWPSANVGIATGRASGIVVIDLDLPDAESSLERLASLGLSLSPTLTVITGGGRHLYFACDRHLSNTTRRLPGLGEDLLGIDLRADGGYVVGPPSIHITSTTYRWVDPEARPAPLPHWIRAPQPRANYSSSMGSASALRGAGTAYGLAALRDEIDVLTKTPEGGRNDQLNRSAFALGQLVGAGELAEQTVLAELKDAGIRIGLDHRETVKTIKSGLSAGSQEPRERF